MPIVRRSESRERLLADFQHALGFKFKNSALLDRALSHRSYVSENAASSGNNERLEFLGDSVLGMVTASRLFSALGDRPEGDLARIKSIVVSESTLADIAIELGIDRLLLLGKGEDHSGGRAKKAILADALEAVFGAAFIDSGFTKTEKFVLALIKPEIEKILHDKHRKDYKTLLQEYAQKWHRACPLYTLSKKTGPDHDRIYWMFCTLCDMRYGPASGKTKKEAEQAAAEIAYTAIIDTGGIGAERLLSIKKF